MSPDVVQTGSSWENEWCTTMASTWNCPSRCFAVMSTLSRTMSATLSATLPRTLRFAGGHQVRLKHSSTQVNRLFKKNPARIRVESRLGIDRTPKPLEPRQFPAIFDVQFLRNGWSAPPPEDQVPEYPFRVTRTNNKPNDGTGFLPVYAKFR